MGKLGFNVSKKQRPIEGKDASYCECGGDSVRPIGGSCNEAGAGALDEYDVDDADDEESMLGGSEYSRQQQIQQHSEPSKKIFLMCLIATTVVACFILYAAMPQLVDYLTEPNDTKLESSIYSHQKSVVELPDMERSPRNQERLDIMRRFNALQQKYKELQIQYKKAEEAYLKKLHNAAAEENLGTQDPEVKIVNGFAEPDKIEIYKLEDIKNVHEDTSKKPVEEKKVVN
ncbi:uncharacterized protein LOC106637434 [Copidosoma floridanum]|uniref:uncharacterized protein LOC106637434 n=1 Tax=Copidosoma floridanum TaxID=29053 RepID=UPI0006C9595D|nr:uncharacterized protein LOC106637434 [Copidosoma floridanum]